MLWLTQDQISQLFELERSVITKHIKNVFQSAKLEEDLVYAFLARPTNDGKSTKSNTTILT